MSRDNIAVNKLAMAFKYHHILRSFLNVLLLFLGTFELIMYG